MNTVNIYCKDIKQPTVAQILVPLGNNETHIYYFDLEKFILKTNSLLSVHEMEKAGKFRKDLDKKAFSVGKQLTRLIIQTYNKEMPLIKLNNNNKPFIYENSGLIAKEFNISHSQNHLVIAVCRNEIGIDIETIRETEWNSIRNDCFSKKENSHIDNSMEGSSSFYKYWTRKESFLKAEGIGLIDNLKSLEVLDGENIFLTRNSIKYPSHHISTFFLNKNVICSVCCTTGEFNTLTLFDGSALY